MSMSFSMFNFFGYYRQQQIQKHWNSVAISLSVDAFVCCFCCCPRGDFQFPELIIGGTFQTKWAATKNQKNSESNIA